MGLNEETLVGIRVSGLLHDIGKISVPAQILTRPGALTAIEFELIKAHSQVTHDLLQPIEFPWPVAEIALQHHERLDGSGYPQGLLGQATRIEARILAVADVVEAMASYRPYRPALGVEAALAEIAANRGRLYDPSVADACLAVFRDGGFTFD
jgi:HD-GYP domain-containing protein (c-di-GMP phosphodiesterase class II)